MTKPTYRLLDSVDFCKAMADDTRQAILRLLKVRTEMTVSEIVSAFKLSQPTISHHLGILRRYGLVHTRQEGKTVYYQLDMENLTECCGLLVARFSVVLDKDIAVER